MEEFRLILLKSFWKKDPFCRVQFSSELDKDNCYDIYATLDGTRVTESVKISAEKLRNSSQSVRSFLEGEAFNTLFEQIIRDTKIRRIVREHRERQEP